MNSTLRNTLAVAAGLATILILSNGTDTVLEATGAFPSLAEQRSHGFNTPWMLAIALAYRAVAGYVGGLVTAIIARRGSMGPVYVLIAIGFVLGVAGAVATKDIVPLWFSVSVLVVTSVTVWAGGRRACAGTRSDLKSGPSQISVVEG